MKHPVLGAPVRTTLSWGATDLHPLPYESAVSSLWRFAWRNVPTSETVRKSLTKRKSFSNCQYGTDIGWLDPDKAKEVTGWSGYSDNERSFLNGHGKDSALWVHLRFRFCPLCLGDTYHSFWHQSVFLDACPVHHIELRSDCQSCGAPTEKHALSRKLLASPYACHSCRQPLAGIAPTIEARLELQKFETELQACFVPFSSWWDSGRFVRDRFHGAMVGSFWKGASDRRTQLVMRSALQVGCPPIHQMKTYPLPLDSCFWRSIATPRSLTDYVDDGHRHRAYVEDAYRRTVRYLEATIADRFPYSVEDYKSHLNFRIDDEGVLTAQYQPHLLALSIMRRKLEADYGYLSIRLENSSLRSPFRYSFSKRSHRQHCGSAFLTVYASAFACVQGARNGVMTIEDLAEVGVHNLQIYCQGGSLWKRGRFGYVQFYWGGAVWPEVAGLQLPPGAYLPSGKLPDRFLRKGQSALKEADHNV